MKGKTGAISFLHVSEEKSLKEPKPTILFIHGFQSVKENNLHYAYLLAEKGFRVIMPDCLHHGDREMGLSSTEMMQAFWDIVIQSIHELEVLKNYLVEEKLADEDAIGVAGTSMGGIVTFGALKKYPWIRTAVSLMGCPSYQEFAKWKLDQVVALGVALPFKEAEIKLYLSQLAEYDLSMNLESLNERPLFCWHGAQDQEVPIEPVLEFVKNCEEHYRNKPENLKLLVEKRADHKVSREGVLTTVEWFEMHMNTPVKSN